MSEICKNKVLLKLNISLPTTISRIRRATFDIEYFYFNDARATTNHVQQNTT